MQASRDAVTTERHSSGTSSPYTAAPGADMMRGRGRDDECAYRPQLPLALADDSEPPDAAVVEGDVERYRHEHPRHPVLVVEVADATLAFDRSRKATMYATRVGDLLP